ncbi:SAM domain and HD domain 1 [Angomonas deanei]|uniref:HD domain containing protein, putative n=1 Tax=Angomonas deanei TaxID=59799 RepID=A0A7G2CAP1_9TRYP|nr:SAM domain and HD domain 1 [Angomonas deanei]CAD2216141.1 HD domain containing protein, putative [Angomonas deanei]|eukprot:EPY32431.1 SAM domain and HD domain 1 [Angomonas deanei]
MVFPPVLSVFIDSPVVQRLRGLKQLGMTDYVYPGATHTRFEHSLGVSHLAMEFLRQIWLNHNRTGGFSSYPLPPEVELDRVRTILSERETTYSEADVREWVEKEYERDVWCLGIAGLCHDLGHGPLSHMFEDFIKQLERQEKVKDGFQHEWMSAQLLEMIWKKNENVLDQFGFDTRDLFFIRLLIEGLPPDVPFDEEATGRPRWKRFMTEIVANKRNGLDVDKLDYLQRDSLSTQGTLALPSLNRLFQAACAAHDDQGTWQICYVEKVDDTMEEVFLARARLHRRVYQHRVTLVMSCMMCDVFLAAEPYFKVHHNGKEYTLSEVSKVPEAFVEVADWVVDAIQHSAEPKLHLAQNIIRRIKSRQIYQTVAFYGVSSTKKSPAVQVPPLTTVVDTTSTQGSSTPVKKERRPDDGGARLRSTSCTEPSSGWTTTCTPPW